MTPRADRIPGMLAALALSACSHESGRDVEITDVFDESVPVDIATDRGGSDTETPDAVTPDVSSELADGSGAPPLIPPEVGVVCPPQCEIPCDIPTPMGVEHPRSRYQSRPPREIITPALAGEDLPVIRCSIDTACPVWLRGLNLRAHQDFISDGSVCCPTHDHRVTFTGNGARAEVNWTNGHTYTGEYGYAQLPVQVDGNTLQILASEIVDAVDSATQLRIRPCSYQVALTSSAREVLWLALYELGVRALEGGFIVDVPRNTVRILARDDREEPYNRPRLIELSLTDGSELYRSGPFEFPTPPDMSPAYLLEPGQMVYSAAFQAGVFDGTVAHPIELGLGTRRTSEYDILGNNPPLRLADGTVLLSSDAGYQWINTETLELIEIDTWMWRIGRGERMISSVPPVIHPDGSYYQATGFGMVRYDRSAPVGERVRVFPTGQLFKSPMVARDGVVIAVSTDTVIAFAPGPDPRELWSIDVFPGQHATGVLLDDGVLIFGTRAGELYVLQTPHHGLARTPMPTWRGDNQRSGMPPAPPYDTAPTQEPLWRLPNPDEGSAEGSGAAP